MRRLSGSQGINADNAAKHELITPLIEAMFKEFQDAARKKPDAALNKRKVEIVNRVLRDVLEILEDEPSRGYIDLLDEDDLPQNSDVSLILGQAVAAMGAFKEKYHSWNGHEHVWSLKK
ncbi:hypothetical protein [Falsiroseomonas sp. CW058]|uniref:hypothetical protein n=1 Tax=Falsiroseomonas sp. CW058 TaxID=3388664 RepID=UPI003D30F171